MKISRKILNVILVFIYSLFVMCFPWEIKGNFSFIDRENYYNYFKYEENRLNFIEFENIFDFFKNEWFWHYFIGLLNSFLELKMVFFIIGFLLLFSYCFLLYKETNIFYLILMFNPLIIDLIYSQLRISLALTFLIWSLILYKNKKIIYIFFLVISLFTHSAILPILTIYLISIFIAKNGWDNRLKLIGSTFLGFIFSMILGPFRDYFLVYIGDRRIEYNSDVLNSSFIYLSFWILLLIIFYFQIFYYKNNIKIKNENVIFSVSMLSLIFFNLFIGGYSTRFLALSLPFILILIYNLNNFFKTFIILLYIFYVSIYFYLWW